MDSYHPEPVILPGEKGTWNNIKINDPCPVVLNGRILIYYKGAPVERGNEYLIRMQGVSFADHPLGPFEASSINPVINSGHETCMFPWKKGVAALVALDGPEKNTIQYAPDGENFKIVSLIQVPPVAPGPYCPDAFSDSGNGRGFLWGLCHINPDGGGAVSESILARFDCDLSVDVDERKFKRNNLRFNASTYFQRGVVLSQGWRERIQKNEKMLIMKRFISLVVLCTCMFDAGAQVSAAMKRNPHVNSESELYTRFLYEPVEGLGYERGINRRDPSSIIHYNDKYYV